MNDLIKRIIVSFLALLIFAFSLRYTVVFILLLFLLSFFLQREYFLILKKRGIKSFFKLTLMLNFFILGISVYFAHNPKIFSNSIFFYLLLYSLCFEIICIYQVVKFGTENILENITTSAMALIYITTPAVVGYFIYVNCNLFYLMYPLVLVWITDTMAYFLGCTFGKKKIAPLISPNKTYIGTFGSIIITTIIFLLIKLFWKSMPFSFFEILLFTSLLTAVGHIGDFTESALKRYVGIKDSGNFLPGHGGFLDRFDSLLFVIPIYTILLKIGGIF